MLDLEVASTLSHFGTAGLMGWLWVSERRAAATRERQLHEVHERLMQERRCLAVTIDTLRENSRVLAGIESGQRALAAAIDRLLRPHPSEHAA